FTITAVNVPPTAGILGAPASSPEGALISLSASASDPSPVDTVAGFTYAWSVTRNSAAFSSGSAANFSFTPDDNGTYVVGLTVTDKDGGSGSDSKTVAVTNVAPTATVSLPLAAVYEGSSFTIALTSAYDPSTVDTSAGFTYAFDCGHGAGFVGTGVVSSL